MSQTRGFLSPRYRPLWRERDGPGRGRGGPGRGQRCWRPRGWTLKSPRAARPARCAATAARPTPPWRTAASWGRAPAANGGAPARPSCGPARFTTNTPEWANKSSYMLTR
eukprot:2265272-Pyramimonas_sp.AAC.3